MADLKIVDIIRKHGFFVVFVGLIVFLPLLWVFPSRGLIALYFDNAEWQGEPVITQQERLVNLDVVAHRQDTFPQSNFSVTWEGGLESIGKVTMPFQPNPMTAPRLKLTEK
jgi:hypothetical protein